MRRRSHKPCRQGQRGVVAILVALLIFILCGFATLVIDMGYMYHVRSDLQNAVDAGATAGVRELDQTPAGIQNARVRVREFTNLHYANQTPVNIPDADIIFGHWALPTGPFTPYGPDPAPALLPLTNSLQVIGRRSAATGNELDMRFAGLIGFHKADIAASATAIGGCPAQECGFPMVVADCSLNEPITNGTCEWCMVFQNNNSDTAGWTDFGLKQTSIEDIIINACGSQGTGFTVDDNTKKCTNACNQATAGTEIPVNNGNNMNKNNYCKRIQDILLRDGPPAQPFRVSVPVIGSTPGTCDATQFSSSKPIAGFAVLEIFGAQCEHSGPLVVADGAPAECSVNTGSSTYTPPSGKFIAARLLCNLESPYAGGGECFGMIARRTRLVR